MRQPAQTCIVLMYSKCHCCFEQKSASLYFLEDSGILKCINRIQQDNFQAWLKQQSQA